MQHAMMWLTRKWCFPHQMQLCVYICVRKLSVCACVGPSLSNYLLQPSDNNGGLIKAKPGGAYTHWCAAGNFLPARSPLTGQEWWLPHGPSARRKTEHVFTDLRGAEIVSTLPATASAFCWVIRLLRRTHWDPRRNEVTRTYFNITNHHS